MKIGIKTVCAASVVIAGVFSFGIGIGSTLGQGMGEKPAKAEKKEVKDEYKKYRKDFEKEAYKETLKKDQPTLVSGSNSVLAKGIMGTWVPDKEATQAAGQKLLMPEDTTVTFMPTKEPSKTLIKKIQETAQSKRNDANRKGAKPEDERLANAWSAAEKRIIRWGKMKISMMGGAMEMEGDWLLCHLGDNIVMVNFKNPERGDDIEVGYVGLRHTKDGVHDSISVGGEDGVKVVWKRAAEAETVTKARKGK